MKLIEVWGEDTIQAQLEGCKHNSEVYDKILKAMKDAGYYKSLERYREKVNGVNPGR